jgi:hypothetical protein
MSVPGQVDHGHDVAPDLPGRLGDLTDVLFSHH